LSERGEREREKEREKERERERERDKKWPRARASWLRFTFNALVLEKKYFEIFKTCDDRITVLS
jgi:hypothetical protein